MSEVKMKQWTLWPIDKVLPYDKNAKKHDTAQVKGIAASIERFGWDQPIVVDKDGVVIKGHGRRLAAIELGFKKVPVLVRDDLTPEQVRAARLADNRVALGSFDTELMRIEMKDLDLAMFKDIYLEKELVFNVNTDLGEMTDDAFVPDVDAAVASQEQEAKDKADATAARRVPLGKVFGFKDIQGSNEIVFTRFIARAEAETGKQGEDAVVEMLKKLAA